MIALLSVRCFDCRRRWCETGTHDLECVFCGSLNVRRYVRRPPTFLERFSCR